MTERLAGLTVELLNKGFKVIATIRAREEGGNREVDPRLKVLVYKRLLDLEVTYVDMEYRLIHRGVDVSWLDDYKGRVIVSIHDLDGESGGLSARVAGEVVDTAVKLEGIAKIAPVINDLSLLESMIRLARDDVTIVGMGRYSLVSRVASLLRGSKITYGAHPEGPFTAPGQPVSEEIVRIYSVVADSCLGSP